MTNMEEKIKQVDKELAKYQRLVRDPSTNQMALVYAWEDYLDAKRKLRTLWDLNIKLEEGR